MNEEQSLEIKQIVDDLVAVIEEIELILSKEVEGFANE